MYSVVLIVDSNSVDQANKLAEILGYGLSNYSVPLSPTGQEPATHYGLHTWAEQEFIDLLSSPTLPENLKQYEGIRTNLVSSVRLNMENHWNDVLALHNLKTIAGKL